MKLQERLGVIGLTILGLWMTATYIGWLLVLPAFRNGRA